MMKANLSSKNLFHQTQEIKIDCDDGNQGGVSQPPMRPNDSGGVVKNIAPDSNKKDKACDGGDNHTDKMVVHVIPKAMDKIVNPLRKNLEIIEYRYAVIHHYMASFFISIGILFLNVYLGYNLWVCTALYFIAYFMMKWKPIILEPADLHYVSSSVIVLSICALPLNHNGVLSDLYLYGLLNHLLPLACGILNRWQVNLLPKPSSLFALSIYFYKLLSGGHVPQKYKKTGGKNQ